MKCSWDRMELRVLDNGYLLVNARGWGLKFGQRYFPNMSDLADFLMELDKECREKTDPAESPQK